MTLASRLDRSYYQRDTSSKNSMSMKRRVDDMTGAALARREAAWQPYVDQVAEADVAPEVIRAQREWPNLSPEEQKAGWAELPPWGGDASAWEAWWEAFDATLEEKGVGEGWPGVWPEQVPAPPQEPAGLWEELHDRAAAQTAPWPSRCAAAHALLWLIVARSLRRSAASAIAPRPE